jgi:phosphotransferase family enzyme
VHVWGRHQKRCFFAKILQQDRFPVARPQVLLGVAPPGPPEMTSAQAQLEREWQIGSLLHSKAQDSLGGGIPAPLGLSVAERTIVWEGIEGRTVESLLTRGPATPIKHLYEAARQTGRLLRTLHSSADRCEDNIDLVPIHASVTARLQDCMSQHRHHYETALRVLEQLMARVPDGRLPALTGLVHGDFSPANVIWDHLSGRAYLVDFEHSHPDRLLFDLTSWTFNVRVKLLHPMVTTHAAITAETAFWEGYGTATKQNLPFLAKSLAAIRIFFSYVPTDLSGRIRASSGYRRLALSIYGAGPYKMILQRRRRGLLEGVDPGST